MEGFFCKNSLVYNSCSIKNGTINIFKAKQSSACTINQSRLGGF